MKLDTDLIMLFYSKFGKKTSILNDKVIWLVGSSSGIGAALAIELAANGSKLVLSATRQNKLEDVKRKCLAANSKLTDADILVLPLDITDSASHQMKLDQVLVHFGRVDILVNNAGQYQMALFEETDLAVDKACFELNVFGVINMTRVVVRYWLANKLKGHLAITSSVYGILGGPTSGPYVASKHALMGYFESIRIELFTRNITVTIVCPGPVDTELFEKSLTSSLTKKIEEKKFNFGVEMMRVERCAKLYGVAIANKVNTAWIIVQPVLIMAYIGTYMPTLLSNTWPRLFNEQKLRILARGQNPH